MASATTLNVNALEFVPGFVVGDASSIQGGSASQGSVPGSEATAATATFVSVEDDYDADLEEVMNALEELQESQINREVEEQLMHEMELYAGDFDDDCDEDDFITEQPPRSHAESCKSRLAEQTSVARCKFAPHCRDGSRACRFSHQHMGACKFGDACRNFQCNFMH